MNGSLNATVSDQTKTWTVTGTVTRHVAESFSSVAGTLSFSIAVNGQRTLVVTDGTVTHTVIITVNSLDNIVIEVDGVTFGPYTLGQVRFWFGLDCNG